MDLSEDKPVLVFQHEHDADACKDFLNKSQHIKAETFVEPKNVFLPKPFGLASVRGARNGETAYCKSEIL
jgi:hypothetical protein